MKLYLAENTIILSACFRLCAPKENLAVPGC